MRRMRRLLIISFAAYIAFFTYTATAYYLTSTDVFILGELESDPAGGHLFTADSCYVDVWDVPEGELVKKIPVEGRVNTLSFSPTGKLAVGTWEGEVKLIDTKELKVSGRYRASASVSALRFTPRGELLVGCEDGTVTYLTENLTCRATFQLYSPVYSLLPLENHLVAAATPEQVYLLNPSGQNVSGTIKMGGVVSMAAHHGDIFLLRENGVLHQLSEENQTVLRRWT